MPTNLRSGDRTCEYVVMRLKSFSKNLCLCVYFFWYGTGPVRDDISSVSTLWSPNMAADPLARGCRICETLTTSNDWMTCPSNIPHRRIFK